MLVSRTGVIAVAIAVRVLGAVSEHSRNVYAVPARVRAKAVLAAVVQPAKRVRCRQVRVAICNSTGKILISTITIFYH